MWKRFFNVRMWLVALTLAVIGTVQVASLSPVFAFDIFGAGGTQSVCAQDPQATVCEAQNSGGFLGKHGILVHILDVLVWATAVVSVFMMVIGGLRYVLSGGDNSGVASAKNTIIYGVTGLVIAVFGGAIILFVLSLLK